MTILTFVPRLGVLHILSWEGWNEVRDQWIAMDLQRSHAVLLQKGIEKKNASTNCQKEHQVMWERETKSGYLIPQQVYYTLYRLQNDPYTLSLCYTCCSPNAEPETMTKVRMRGMFLELTAWEKFPSTEMEHSRFKLRRDEILWI